MHGHTISRGIFGSINPSYFGLEVLDPEQSTCEHGDVPGLLSRLSENKWSGAGLGTHPVEEEQRFYGGTTWI